MWQYIISCKTWYSSALNEHQDQIAKYVNLQDTLANTWELVVSS
jgi:hypothetical protein